MELAARAAWHSALMSQSLHFQRTKSTNIAAEGKVKHEHHENREESGAAQPWKRCRTLLANAAEHMLIRLPRTSCLSSPVPDSSQSTRNLPCMGKEFRAGYCVYHAPWSCPQTSSLHPLPRNPPPLGTTVPAEAVRSICLPLQMSYFLNFLS